MILFAFPPLIAGDLLLELERTLDWPFFDARRGGDPLLWQHLFWIFGHPEVYIVFLPSVALVAMIVPTFARRPIVGYSWIVLAAVGTGFLSFGLWVHHMFTTGLPGVALGIFSAASLAVAIPTGVQIFCFIATVAGTRSRMSVPMLFVIGTIAVFVIGGLTGVMVAVAPFDFQAHDTYFVVAHLHTVLIGGAVFPIVGGFYYFFPLALGKRLSDRLGKVIFGFMFVGFNLTFMPMHFTGLTGMVRRVYTYPEGLGLETLNLTSSIGAGILAIGVALFAWDVVRPRKNQPYAERNPWGAGTLEWIGEMPGRPWGIRSVPEVDSRYPLWDQPDLMQHVDEGRYYLPDAEEHKRETLITTPVDAVPIQCLRIGGPSFVPMWAAIFTGGLFIFATFHLWIEALLSGVLAMAVIIYWLWTATAIIPEKPAKPVGFNTTLPLYASGQASVGWWAMFIMMLGDSAAFVSLLFGYFFYWSLRPTFMVDVGGPGTFWPTVAALLAITSWLLTLIARRANRRDAGALFYFGLLFAAVTSGASAAGLIAAPMLTGLDPQRSVYDATVWVLVLWTAAHLALGTVMQVYCIARRFARRMDARHDIDMANTGLYWHFAAFTCVLTVGTIAVFPLFK
jgi:cytochrome c oxidase subunit I+III